MRAARVIELICGLAAGAWGLLVLAYFLFGPSYTGSSSGGQSCSSGSTAGTTVCTTFTVTDTHASALDLGLDPMAKFWLSVMAIVLGTIAISAMLHSRTNSVGWRSALVAGTGLLVALTCLSIASIGMLLLPSLALAIVASVAAFRAERAIAL
jgi:hypothetical protein